MSFAPVSFSPVWFSTDEQLATLAQSYESASMTSKLLGRFEIPEDCASLQGILMPWVRVPLTLKAQGAITLNERLLSFRPESFRAFGWGARGLLKGLFLSFLQAM